MKSNVCHTSTARNYHQPLPFISIPQQQAFCLFVCLFSCVFTLHFLLTFPTIQALGALDWLYKWYYIDHSVGSEGECRRRALAVINAALRVKSCWSGKPHLHAVKQYHILSHLSLLAEKGFHPLQNVSSFFYGFLVWLVGWAFKNKIVP